MNDPGSTDGNRSPETAVYQAKWVVSRIRHPGPAARATGAAALLLLLALPWSRSWLEGSMTLHMLVQMPLLAAAGFIMTQALPAAPRARLAERLGGPLPCLLLAVLAAMFWMVPRAMDLALAESRIELAKFVGLPLLVGAPGALAWPRTGMAGRGFVWVNLASMLAVLGWLYRAAPVRVCNSYGESSQFTAGRWMIVLAIAIFTGWLASLFRAPASGRPLSGRTR